MPIQGDAENLIGWYNSATGDWTSPAAHDLLLILIRQREAKVATHLVAKVPSRKPVLEALCENSNWNQSVIQRVSSIYRSGPGPGYHMICGCGQGIGFAAEKYSRTRAHSTEVGDRVACTSCLVSKTG